MPFRPVRPPRPRGFRLPGGLLALPLLLATLPADPSLAASALLETVKENPALARSQLERVIHPALPGCQVGIAQFGIKTTSPVLQRPLHSILQRTA